MRFITPSTGSTLRRAEHSHLRHNSTCASVHPREAFLFRFYNKCWGDQNNHSNIFCFYSKISSTDTPLLLVSPPQGGKVSIDDI